MKKTILLLTAAGVVGCGAQEYPLQKRLIPAEEFARTAKDGGIRDYSIFRVAEEDENARLVPIRSNERSLIAGTAAPVSPEGAAPEFARAALNTGTQMLEPTPVANTEPAAAAGGDARYLSQGFQLKRTLGAPETSFVSDGDVAGGRTPNNAYRQLPRPPQLPQLPPGSSSPYATGQMTHNPSLWPDESQGATLFTDFRAFQSMDVITITINESSVGSKKTKTNSEGKFDLLAGISNFFGLETKSWSSNNEGLSPEALISATTENKFEGKGETKREGALKAQISAVILEVLPNGLMRVEGTKIVSVDKEEEVMVISGLVRARDVNSQNQVESNRIANMRIDFYGRGILGEQQSPGWGARLFNKIWPF